MNNNITIDVKCGCGHAYKGAEALPEIIGVNNLGIWYNCELGSSHLIEPKSFLGKGLKYDKDTILSVKKELSKGDNYVAKEKENSL